MMTQVMMLNPLRKRMVSALVCPSRRTRLLIQNGAVAVVLLLLLLRGPCGAAWCVQALRPMMQILAYGSVIDNDGPRL